MIMQGLSVAGKTLLFSGRFCYARQRLFFALKSLWFENMLILKYFFPLSN